MPAAATGGGSKHSHADGNAVLESARLCYRPTPDMAAGPGPPGKSIESGGPPHSPQTVWGRISRHFCAARRVARNDLPGSPGQIYSMERGPQAVHRLPGEGRHAAVEKAVQPVPPDMAAGPCRPRYGRPPVRTYSFLPQHFLYFKPLPQGQGSLRPGFLPERTGCLVREPSSAPAVAVGFIICSR